MPSLKRLQESSGSDEEQSESGSEPVGSSSPPDSRKRQRTSSSARSGTGEDPDGRASPLVDDALLDDDELELRQTQLIQEKYAHLIDDSNVPAEHGVLERVECYNFMCHDQFSVELGPLINFIVGKNGSGKSAILTAITLCLGGKASATNRGQSLKNFVKEGKENATIIVRIKNQGDGAYLPDDYGKSIIIERHFSKSGSSGFKIKAENGRVVSTKKAELDSISDYFSLQIDNPMNVLSQDMARQFLSTSSPAEKYKFFVKGVQLEQLDQDYRLIEESVDQIEEKLRSQREDLRHLENDKDKAQKKLELADQHNSLRERVKNLQSQMAWAQVEEQERLRDFQALELERADTKIRDAESGIGSFDSAFEESEREVETATEMAYQADSTLEEARGEKEKIQENNNKEMSHRHDLQAEQRNIRDYVKAAEAAVNSNKQKIADEEQRLVDVSNGSYAAKQKESEQASNNAAEAKREYEDHGKDEPRLREDIERAKKEAETAKELVDAKKDAFNQAEGQLRTLAREDGQRKSGFDERMPTLLKYIDQEKSFSKRPIGPIGKHVTLLKPKWSNNLETAFGTTLHSFIVASKRDMDVLEQIMRRVGFHCPVLIGGGGDLDTSAHEPAAHFDTALRILQIDNPMVRRHLIITHGVEQTLLIEDLEEASSVLFDGQRPQNVKRCYCIDKRDRRRGIFLSYNRMGDPSQAPIGIYPGHPRMKSDVASQISAQREVVEDLRRQLNDLEQDLRSARNRVEGCKQAQAQHQRRHNDLRIRMQQMEDNSENLREALERENAEDGQLDSLRSTLQDAEAEYKVHEGSLNDCVAALEATTQKLKLIRREMAEQDRKITDLLERSRVAESERSRVDLNRRRILSEKNAAIAQIETDKEARKEIHDKQEQLAAKVLEFSEMASMVSPRVPIDEGETTTSLDQKLTRLRHDMDHYNRRLGASRDEIAAEARRKEAEYLRAMKQVDELTTLAQVFKDTLDNRKKRWEIFRSHISSRAKAQFTYLLSERSFRGRLLANHKEKMLDLQVEPDITKDDSTGRGAKTLSGGEKSFSQVCLLLALWEAMGSPIRGLDEFDVYMDHVNRKLAIDMLMTAARRSIGRQFILITPGTKTDITISPDVRVKELAEPERGQTSLPFQRR